MDAAAATAVCPASSKQQRSLENSFAVQSRESIDEKIAVCSYANDTSFATRRDGARRAGTRARAVGRWAHTPTRTRGTGLVKTFENARKTREKTVRFVLFEKTRENGAKKRSVTTLAP